jgi:hypothetical protein
MGSETGWLSDEVRAEQSLGVRDLLQRSLHSDLDILLPKMGSTGAVELFFIVAITDGIGGEAISKRIREQMNRSESPRQAGVTLSTSYRSLEAIKRNAGESIEDSLHAAAAKLQQLMNDEISSRVVKNGQ